MFRRDDEVAASRSGASPAANRRVGVPAPLAGVSASIRKHLGNGVRLALGEACLRRIRLGGREVRFELDSVDEPGDPGIGVQVAQKLVDDGVVAVLEVWPSDGFAARRASACHACRRRVVEPWGVRPARRRTSRSIVQIGVLTDSWCGLRIMPLSCITTTDLEHKLR